MSQGIVRTGEIQGIKKVVVRLLRQNRGDHNLFRWCFISLADQPEGPDFLAYQPEVPGGPALSIRRSCVSRPAC